MFVSFVSQLLFENIGYYQILAHRFARRTALRYYVKHSLVHVDYVEQSRHSFGVDVVFHVEFRSLSDALFEFVMVQMAKSLEYCHRAESRTAYSQYHESIEFFSYVFSRGDYVLDYFVLVVRKLGPTHHVLTASFFYRRKRVFSGAFV